MSIRRLAPAVILLGALAPVCAWAAPDGPKPIPAAAPASKPAASGASTPAASSASSPSSAPGVGKDPDALAIAFADSVDDALTRAVASVEESSVTIFAAKKQPDGSLRRESGGSGTFVLWKGKGPFILTNEHVVKGADALDIIAFDGTVYQGKLKDHVATYDIALLDILGPAPKKFKAAKFGKSETLTEGQWVIATGNPFFLAGDGRCVATLGVISGRERFLRGEFTYADAIQHDAEVNPGNSGGPLWNLAGEFVGINGMISTRGDGSSAGASNTGASFSIPIHLILRYFDDLLSDKVAACAGYLGVEVKSETDAAGKPVGLRIVRIVEDSPCRKGKPDAKVLVPTKDDILVQVTLGGLGATKTYDLFSSADLTNALAPYGSGVKVKLKVLRAGKSFTWTGELGGVGK